VIQVAVIGIIGGVACGKSFVAEQFRSLGAEVINADRIGHEVLRESDVRAALVQRWGDKVLDADGQVSRSAIGQRVFSGKLDERGNLEFLESLVHPKIGQRIGARIEALSRDDPGKSVVVDAALLMEADWAHFCDKVVFVDAPVEQRLGRAKQRGWSDSEFSAREAAQGNLEMKRKQADWVMDNSGSAEHTFAQVQQFWRTLK
jgi:dephospho-CoA kinase